jgi:cysteinyl-tRNA synthetase
MTSVLGINPLDWADASGANDQALDSLIQSLIEERKVARADKDFARSDAIRNQLQAAGITLEDAADGTHWSVN